MDKKLIQGFTLAELIIVLAVIAILGALSVSRLTYHEINTRNRTCNAIMENIAMAAEAYMINTGMKLEGVAAIVDDDCALVTEHYISAVPNHTHVSEVGEYYFITWAGNHALVTCPSDPDGAGPLPKGVTYPPGHEIK